MSPFPGPRAKEAEPRPAGIRSGPGRFARGRWQRTTLFALVGAAGLAATAGLQARAAPGERAPTALAPLEAAGLQVTLGTLGRRGSDLLVESPKFRAVALRGRTPEAALSFTLLGNTEAIAPLASGELRRQLGLKLLAADGCNLVYVMWRIDPRPGIVVSIKRNPGATTHAACGAGGYRNMRPQRVVPVGRPEPGRRHLLAARLRQERLEVEVDGKVVWEGRLGGAISGFDGPVGLRTDNVRVAFQLRVPADARPAARAIEGG